MTLLPPVINVGPDGRKAWLQAGLKYGRNESGPFQSFSKEGTQAEVEDYAIVLDSAGWTWTVERLKGGLARIDGHAGWGNGSSSTYTPEVPEEIWELDPNETDKALLEADWPFASVNLVSKQTSTALAKILEQDDYIWSKKPAGPADWFIARPVPSIIISIQSMRTWTTPRTTRAIPMASWWILAPTLFTPPIMMPRTAFTCC